MNRVRVGGRLPDWEGERRTAAVITLSGRSGWEQLIDLLRAGQAFELMFAMVAEGKLGGEVVACQRESGL